MAKAGKRARAQREAGLHIIVPIKQVPETSQVKMDPVTGTMVRDGVESIVNPLDLFAIEAANLLREAHGGRVTALSMGPRRRRRPCARRWGWAATTRCS